MTVKEYDLRHACQRLWASNAARTPKVPTTGHIKSGHSIEGSIPLSRYLRLSTIEISVVIKVYQPAVDFGSVQNFFAPQSSEQ